MEPGVFVRVIKKTVVQVRGARPPRIHDLRAARKDYESGYAFWRGEFEHLIPQVPIEPPLALGQVVDQPLLASAGLGARWVTRFRALAAARACGANASPLSVSWICASTAVESPANT